MSSCQEFATSTSLTILLLAIYNYQKIFLVTEYSCGNCNNLNLDSGIMIAHTVMSSTLNTMSDAVLNIHNFMLNSIIYKQLLQTPSTNQGNAIIALLRPPGEPRGNARPELVCRISNYILSIEKLNINGGGGGERERRWRSS